MNYQAAWNALQDRLIACHARCVDEADPLADDVASFITNTLEIMQEIEEEGEQRIFHCV